jgi:hypothetical protein
MLLKRGYSPTISLQMEMYARDADALASHHLDAMAEEAYASFKTL